MNMLDERLNNALNALREYWQGTAHDVAILRETSHNGGQRLGQLTADVEMLRQELQGVQQNAPELDTLRQELLTALREIDHRHGQRIDQLAAEAETLRQELPANLRETSDTRSQRLDQLAADLEIMSQRLLAALREAGDVRDQRFDQLASDLDALRREWQNTRQNTLELDTLRQELQGIRQNVPDLDALRQELQGIRQNVPDLDALRQELQDIRQNVPGLDTLRREWQDVRQNAPELDTLRQELQGIRQNNSELERSLRIQLAKAREQLDAHTHEMAALTERAQTQSQEMSEHIQTLTGLHQQEQSQRETALATLSKLNERASNIEQQMSANQTRAADTLRVDQNRLAALEKWLTTQAEQFGRFDPILRELHNELVSTHQRLAALESAEVAGALDHHEQRLNETEQSVHDQLNALGEIQQTLEQLATRAPATAKLNRTLIGALAAAGVVIIGLLVMLAVG